MAELELRSLTKTYPGGRKVVDDLSLSVPDGSFAVLVGPSGCGKSTTLRMIAGLEKVDGGDIVIGGKRVNGVSPQRRDIAFVFQNFALYPHMTVADNMGFGLRMRKVPADERRSRAVEALEMVGLGRFAERFAHQLSGGQQQRVALARALVTRPRVLLLDEPLSALDAKVRVQLRDEIRRIQTELGITTVFVTHDQEEALAVADRVAVMRDGAIEQIGTPEELYATPATAFVADFVGLSNRVPADLVAGKVVLHGKKLDLLGSLLPDGPVTAYVRPEDVSIESSGIPATVVSSSFLGSLRRTQVRLADDSLLSIQHDVDLRPLPGETVHLRLKGAPVAAVPRG